MSNFRSGRPGNFSLLADVGAKKQREEFPFPHAVIFPLPATAEVLLAQGLLLMSPLPMRVLVVEDDAAMREVLETRLESWGCNVRSAGTAKAALAEMERDACDVVLSDLVLPDSTGLDLLPGLQRAAADQSVPCTVILMTAYGTIDTAVDGMKRGARDYLTKPLDYVALRKLLDEIGRERAPTAPMAAPRASGARLGELVGGSSAQLKLYRLMRRVAASDATVLIIGESGTGKELVARTVHGLGERRANPFVAVNSAAIPETLMEAELFGHERGAFTGAVTGRPGLFEQANGGTLFLDEITEMALPLQTKLLRVLEERRVRPLGGQREVVLDVRVIAATNRDPQKAVEEGRLRLDLFYRLNVFQVPVAPLRERADDIPELARHLIAELRDAEPGDDVIEADALERLVGHRWPGNVRELRNVLERAVIMAGDRPVRADDLPPLEQAAQPEPPRGIVLPHRVTSAEAERILILETLRQTDNNKAEAARRLGLDVKTIRNKLKAFSKGP